MFRKMIIIEGLDGVGKSTVVERLKTFGFINLHYDYDSSNYDLTQKYLSVLNYNDLDKYIADRSFFSEMVYGPVLRNGSRISDEQFIKLLKEYSKIGAKVIYLTSDKDILLKRRQEDEKDFKTLTDYYSELNSQYEKAMNITAKYIPVLHIDTSEKSAEQTFKQCEDFVLGSKKDDERIL